MKLTLIGALATVVSAIGNPLINRLTGASIVPNVVPVFTPQTFPHLRFPRAVAFLGTNIPKAEAVAPALTFVGEGGTYTLAIVDPDAPERTNNILSQVRHFIASGIPSLTPDQNISSLTNILAPYLQPQPPAGCGDHRYVAVLLKEPAGGYTPATPLSPSPLFFSIKDYAVANGLTVVGVNYWVSSADPAPFCTFFTDATETFIQPAYVSAFYLPSNKTSDYLKQPN